MRKKEYALITGASKGLGYCMAEVCARRGMNLLLVSLPGEGLAAKAEALGEKYGISAESFELDLTHKEQLEELVEGINGKFQVDFLVNNAGFGGARSFRDAPGSYLDDMILLNVRALVLLTHGLLPNLENQERAYILNIASLASFGPMPFKTVYPASKAFVWSFSRGLHAELRGTGVSVSVVHPGGMTTNEEVSRRMEHHGRLARSTFLSPEKVAEICIRQTLKGDTLIIPGFMNKLSWLGLVTIPVWLKIRILRRTFLREVNAESITFD